MADDWNFNLPESIANYLETGKAKRRVVAQTDEDPIQNSPFQKAFGGGLTTPTPTPTPAPKPTNVAWSPTSIGSSIADKALASTRVATGVWSNVMPGQASSGIELPQAPQAQFIGQHGGIFTGPAGGVAQPQFSGERGRGLYGGVIDARAPVVFGGALSAPSLSRPFGQAQGGPSLTPPGAWQAQFQPSSDLAQLIAQSKNPDKTLPNLFS
jgi:hypothetical protein